ncbi:PA14 domain-containing protein [Cellvibrio mixtus]|uniref:PA14 domain-containing protein n=1 Tax=Cellvibrio mixtus TaxID=39650 RepID=UPI0005871812|nr:DUF6701 domain-containing protein [Cellvibrio mixtus]
MRNPLQLFFIKSKAILLLWILAVILIANTVHAATYNLTSGSYPPCNTSWAVSGSTYTCSGNGRVSLASGDIVIANTNVTIFANDGFSLSSNTTIGSASANINLISNYGTITSSGTSSIYGTVNAGSGVVTLINTNVNGALTSSGNVNLTGGSVSGLVTSSSNTITTNGTNLLAGATAQSGMTITGGTIAGNFTMTAYNAITLSGVTMTSGSISGSSIVTIQNGSVLGSSSSAISISSNSGAITVNNSTVYGNLTAPNYSTVNVTNGAQVYGTCTPGSTPANACSGSSASICPSGIASGITGNYYNNTSLTEPATATRSDGPIDFTWGSGAPGPTGVTADTFSVRWSGYVRATTSGTYRFRTVSDDGVRLYLNGNLIINRWNDHSPTTDTSADISLVAGQSYSLVLEYYENAGSATMQLSWQTPGAASYVAIPAGPTPTLGSGLYECMAVIKPPVSSCSTSLAAGITGKYFNNMLASGTVVATRSDGPINFDWGGGAPGPTGVNADNFSVSWDGYLRITQSGVYRFQTNSDDGIRLRVNGDLIIDQWNDHSVTTHTSNAVNLVAGNSYPIKLEFYENGGYAVAQLLWQTPAGGAYTAIPKGSTPVSTAGLYECVTTPASYLLANNSTGITCAAEAVTVTALNAANAAYAPPAGTVVTMSTNPATGVWVGGATYTFTGTESSFTKYLQQTTPAALAIAANSTTATGASSITFADTGLKIALNTALNPIPTQVAAVNGPAIIRAVRTSTTTGACEARIGAGTRTVNMAYTCINPNSCNIATEFFRVSGTSIQGNNNAASSIVYSPVTLTFNASGEAPFTINYTDVGQIRLLGQLSIAASGVDPAITLAGSSDPFIVKPYSLAITDIRNATGTRIIPLAVPANNNVHNTAFVVASEPFSVRVQALNALGSITPNYGKESVPENVAIDIDSIVTPTGGSLGVLNNNAAFSLTSTPGEFLNTTVNWNNVGTIKLSARVADGDYLTGGAASVKPLVNAGRFYPDHYFLNNAGLTPSCSAFTYMDQPFAMNYVIQARGLDNTVLSNYGAGYLPANTNLPTVNYVAENQDGGVDLGGRVYDGAIKNWSNGVFSMTSPAAGFRRLTVSPYVDGPYPSLQLGLRVDDILDGRLIKNPDMNATTTGICSGSTCTGKMIGSAINMRYGRLRLDDAFGPETAYLPVNFYTEHWLGNRFVKNTDDSCTKILRSAINYRAGNILTPANLTVALTGGTTTGNYGSMDATQVSFINGDARQYFSAPTNAAQGVFNVTVDLTAYPWLRFDWNQDNIYSDVSLPPARFGFGSYRGHDRVIYWREIF